jgi:hypothetical protein
MEPIELPDLERERLYRVKKAVAEGTYAVSADALAARLLDSMLEGHAERSLPISDPQQTAAQALLLDQKNG